MAHALDHLGWRLWVTGDIESALKHFKHSLKIREKFDSKADLIWSYNMHCFSYLTIGKLKEALEFGYKGRELFDVVEDKFIKMAIGVFIGYTLNRMGKPAETIEVIENCIALGESVDGQITEMHPHAYIVLGTAFKQIGKLSEAIRALEKGIHLLEKRKDAYWVAYGKGLLGQAYRMKGDLDLATTLLEHSLPFLRLTPRFLSDSLFYLVEINITVDNADDAQKYLHELEGLNETHGTRNPLIKQRYQVAKALLLAAESEPKSKTRAESMLKEIIQSEVADHQVIVVALLSLCDLILSDLAISNDLGLLIEIKDISSQLSKIALTQQSFLLQAQTLVMQSKIALLELNPIEARSLLTEAQVIANEKELYGLAMKISSEHDNLLESIDRWDDVANGYIECDIKCRVDAVRLDIQTSRMTGHLPPEQDETDDEQPVFFLILSNDGMITFSQDFDSANPIDDSLISGFLSSINKFKTEVLVNLDFTIDRIKLAEYTLIIKSQDSLFLVYVFKGPAYSAISRMNKCIYTLLDQERLWSSLLQVSEINQPLSDTDTHQMRSIVVPIIKET